MEHKPTNSTPATPDEIWAILRQVSQNNKELSVWNKELSERQKETARQMQETDRRLKETDRQMQETDRRLKETEQQVRETAQQVKETEQQVKETSEQIKKTEALFTSQWGKLMESLVEGDLLPLLQTRQITVEQTSTNVKGQRNGHSYEFDIVADNTTDVVVVEVKTTLRSEAVTEFVEKLENFTSWMCRYRGHRVLGAVAYLKADSSVVRYAERQGLFVIRATGSSASIVNRAGFEPRVFE